MLTIYQHRDPERLIQYFEEHLRSGEYYTEAGQCQAIWLGKTTEQLGLIAGENSVKEEFAHLAYGRNPKTKKSFLIRANPDRIVAWDMILSAPKTVSIMAVTMSDTRLKDAHEKAASLTFKEIEKFASTRVRKGLPIGSDQRRTTGNLVGVAATHATSRDLDPQLHTHNVVFNVTFDQTENRLKAMSSRPIYDNATLLTEVYRGYLAREVRALGYEVETGKHTFRIKGVSREIEASFSKRSREIEKEARSLEAETGIKVNNKGRALIAGNTRRAKDSALTAGEYVASQTAQLTPEQIKELSTLVEKSKNLAEIRAKENINQKELTPKIAAEMAVDYALDHVFERASVVHRHELIKEALRRAQGHAIISDIEEALKGPRFLHRGMFVMTREERNREINILKIVKDGKRKLTPLSPNTITNLSEKLGDDQKSAIVSILSSKDQFFFMRGAAGVGKTFILSELKRNVAQNLIFLAPTASATDTLRGEGFDNSHTVQLFMKSEFIQDQTKNSVIVVDEAGLMSTRQMEALMIKARELNSRVLLVGDTLQHNSVEGGDALRLIENYSVIAKASVTKIRRQTDPLYRNAIQHLTNGDVARAFDVLDNKLNCIHEIKGDERFEFVAKKYLESVSKDKKTLIVCPTNDEIKKITVEVRAALKEAGRIDKQDHELQVYKSTNFTRVEKKYFGSYSPNQAISFHKTKGEFKQGEVWTVKEIKNEQLIVSHPAKGERVVEPSKLSKKYDVVEPVKSGFTKGDKIIMKANYATSRLNRLPNGAIVTISDIKDDGSILLTNGKTLGQDFRHFTHGYALTSQGSQGKTAEVAIVSADSRSGMALSKNQMGVSCSRGRSEIVIVTDNKIQLKEKVMRSSNRALVTEALVRDRIIAIKFKKVKVTLERTVEASRDVIDRALTKYQSRNKDVKKANIQEMLHPQIENTKTRDKEKKPDLSRGKYNGSRDIE